MERYFKYKRIILAYLVLLPVVASTSPIWEVISNSTTQIEGIINLDTTDIKPVCGFKLWFNSSIQLQKLSAKFSGEEQILTQKTSFEIYFANNYDMSQNLTKLDAVIEDSFSSGYPDITIGWECACQQGDSTCVAVPVTNSGENPSSSTPRFETTTLVTTTAPYVNANPSSETCIILEKQAGLCYMGSSKSTITDVERLLPCGGRCMEDTSCNGINFWEGSGQCDLVLGVTSFSAPALGYVASCQFYKKVANYSA